MYISQMICVSKLNVKLFFHINEGYIMYASIKYTFPQKYKYVVSIEFDLIVDFKSILENKCFIQFVLFDIL